MDRLHKELKGVITDIQRFSVQDGPGIRTTVFLKGCPLRCAWCQNPETNERKAEVGYFKERCVSCGMCVQSCPKSALSVKDMRIVADWKKCDGCGSCVRTCKFEARVLYGYEITVRELVEKLLRDQAFYKNSGGGVTLSGGEPLMQPEFSKSIFRGLKEENVNTAMETSGFCPQAVFRDVIQDVDMILFDVKHTDPVMHKKYTGVSNEIILENLRICVALGKVTVIRIPLIPNFNDDDKNICAIINLAKMENISCIHLMPFHQFGQEKWHALNRKYLFENVKEADENRIRRIAEKLEAAGFSVNIGGGDNYQRNI